MAKNAQPLANPPVTLTQEALKQMLAQVRAEALAERDAASKADSTEQMERLCVKAFKRAGFDDVKPRENVLTYNKWIEQGRKVKEGEKCVKVKNLRLFHISQTEPLAAKEKTRLLAEREARRAVKSADKLPAVSPVTKAA
jgi:hypothetical protein